MNRRKFLSLAGGTIVIGGTTCLKNYPEPVSLRRPVEKFIRTLNND